MQELVDALGVEDVAARELADDGLAVLVGLEMDGEPQPGLPVRHLREPVALGVVAAEDSGVSAVPGHLRKNLTGVIVNADELLLGLLGFARGEMVGHRSAEFLHPDDHQQAFSSWVRLMAKPEVPRTMQVRHRPLIITPGLWRVTRRGRRRGAPR